MSKPAGHLEKRKAGRPPAQPTKPAMIRLTEPQRLRYLELGGARWIKRLIDEEIQGKKHGDKYDT